MEFLSAVHTDVGLRKKTNQDSVLVKLAETDYGKVLFAVVCDGMGGLAKGELASATLIKAFSEWFHFKFPSIFYKAIKEGKLGIEDLQESWDEVIQNTNNVIQEYGIRQGISLGTTAVALLLVDDQYYVLNVGDSRTYMIENGHEMYLITKDQTWVQQQVDEGRMTEEEAEVDPQRNVLLQCVGASEVVIPDFYTGKYEKDTTFMLCSDGFRHVISNEEFYEKINPQVMTSEQLMQQAAVYFTELNKQRREMDNISVILVRAE